MKLTPKQSRTIEVLVSQGSLASEVNHYLTQNTLYSNGNIQNALHCLLCISFMFVTFMHVVYNCSCFGVEFNCTTLQ